MPSLRRVFLVGVVLLRSACAIAGGGVPRSASRRRPRRLVHLASLALHPCTAPRGDRLSRAVPSVRFSSAGIVRAVLVGRLRARQGGVLVSRSAVGPRGSGPRGARCRPSFAAGVWGSAALHQRVEGHHRSPLERPRGRECDPGGARGDHRRTSSGALHECRSGGGRHRRLHATGDTGTPIRRRYPRGATPPPPARAACPPPNPTAPPAPP